MPIEPVDPLSEKGQALLDKICATVSDSLGVCFTSRWVSESDSAELTSSDGHVLKVTKEFLEDSPADNLDAMISTAVTMLRIHKKYTLR